MKDKIYIAGHTGMVGSAILKLLKDCGFTNTLLSSRKELDLVDQNKVLSFLQQHKPSHIIIAAAKVGGIYANNEFPADFIYENLMIECNLIGGAYKAGIKNLLYLGSSCIYPRDAEQPISENSLLSGKLESTNEPYAIAKIAGIKLCESYSRQYKTDYRSIMPTNLYGPNDNFNRNNGHVIPSLIRKFHEAKIENAPSVEVWGDGAPMREFLHVDDLAKACLHVMGLTKQQHLSVTTPVMSHINVGTGSDISIEKLAQLIKEIVGFKGQIVFNKNKPNGTPRKLLNVEKMNKLGWSASISLYEGLQDTYSWFVNNQQNIRD